MDIRTYDGACHCGALGYAYRTALPAPQWSVRACQCRFCRGHDALSTSDPGGALVFHVRNPALLRHYRFGARSADFLLCAGCGVYVGAVMSAPPRTFGIVNLRALTRSPDDLPAAVAVRYDGENRQERIARRTQRWTPVAQSA